MKVLVACEESQRVCAAFREREREAYSCDILEPSGGHPEWHIKGDCLPLLNGNCEFQTMDGVTHGIDGKWDLIIAHPPCTYTTNAGARHLYPKGKLNLSRLYKGLCGKALFESILHADCDRIAVENPVPSKVFEFPEYTQIIQPYQFGHPVTKKTCLWLKGLDALIPTDVVEPVKGRIITMRNGITRYSCWEMDSGKPFGGEDRAKERSKTFEGIAKAMAEQWG